jgi:hypothetical protein
MGEESNTVKPEDFTQLQTKLSEADTRAKRFESMAADLEKQVKAWGDLKPDSVKGMLEDYELLKRDRAVKSDNPEDLDKWKTETEGKIRGELQSEIEKLREDRESLTGRLKELSIVDKATETIGALFNDDVQPFIKDIIRRHVDRDENGEFLIKNDKGEKRFSHANPAKPLSLKEFAEELANKHPSFARPQVKTGARHAGEISTNGNVTDTDVQRYMGMSREQQLSLDPKLRGELAQRAAKLMPVG